VATVGRLTPQPNPNSSRSSVGQRTPRANTWSATENRIAQIVGRESESRNLSSLNRSRATARAISPMPRASSCVDQLRDAIDDLVWLRRGSRFRRAARCLGGMAVSIATQGRPTDMASTIDSGNRVRRPARVHPAGGQARRALFVAGHIEHADVGPFKRVCETASTSPAS